MKTIPLAALHSAFSRPIFGWGWLRSFVGRALSLPLGNRLIHKLFTSCSPEELERRFFVHAAREFGVRYEIEGVNNIPKTGPLIVVANHPKGMPEGLALGAILQEARPGARLLANAKLIQLPLIENSVIPVDLTRPGANAAAVRGMMRQLKAGETVGIFPAGAISTFRKGCMKVSDDAWSDSVAALARKTGATVVPVHFSGNNSWLFHSVTAFGRHLRGLLYFHELARDLRRGNTLHARVGQPVSADELRCFPDHASATHFLREKTYELAHPAPHPKASVFASAALGCR